MSIDKLPASSSATSPPPTIDARLLVTTGLLSAAAPFAMDMYLPAFPLMVTDLSTTATGVQLSLTAFLIGAGLGHVVFGPLSDRIGRRRPLLWGTVIYVLASAAAALAPGIALLVAARVIQGFAGAAGMVISRAILSDLARGPEAARAFSLMMLVGGLAPVIAPVAGSVLTAVIGWRGLLWIVAGLGAVALIASALFAAETRPASVRLETRKAPHPGVSALLNRRFVGNTLAFAFGFATMMAYISASPFVFQDLMGMSQLQYGLVFGLNALVLALTSALSAKLTRRRGAVRLARTGLLVNLVAVVAIFAVVASPVPLIWLTAPILVAVGSLGFILGNTTALALDNVHGAAGLGSAALGLAQFGLAGVVAPLVSLGGGASAFPLAATMVAASMVANLAFLAAGQRPAAADRANAELDAVVAD